MIILDYVRRRMRGEVEDMEKERDKGKVHIQKGKKDKERG
jgi:hypothetical protein